MKQLIFATSNANKLKEIRLIIDGDYEVLGLQDIGHTQEIPEPFNTLEENAVHKVNTIAKLYNINCFAEDTGLMIDALNGEPGVFSARYAGEEKSAKANIAKVLANLGKTTNRAAKFKTVIALFEDGVIHKFDGEVHGTITMQPEGNNGFGYDPIFYKAKFGKTFAEIPLEVKNEISHRKKATEKLINYLKKS